MDPSFGQGSGDSSEFLQSEKEKEKKRSLSLFERLTGVRRQAASTSAVELPSRVETVSLETATERTSAGEDDYLEIPAFLRRGETKR